MIKNKFGERTTYNTVSTSNTIYIQLHSYAEWFKHFPDSLPSMTFVVSSLEGEDAFPDIQVGMFKFSDNGSIWRI